MKYVFICIYKKNNEPKSFRSHTLFSHLLLTLYIQCMNEVINGVKNNLANKYTSLPK